MFELTNAQKAEIEESVIKDFRQKLFLREGDLESHEHTAKMHASVAELATASKKEATKCRADIRALTAAIESRTARYQRFISYAEAEEPVAPTDDDPVIG